MTYDKERCEEKRQQLQRMQSSRIDFSDYAWMQVYEAIAECCEGGQDD